MGHVKLVNEPNQVKQLNQHVKQANKVDGLNLLNQVKTGESYESGGSKHVSFFYLFLFWDILGYEMDEYG